jgi:chemotaxis protein MotB
MLINRLSPRLSEDNPLWLVVLCDLMTNLMLFFLVLFAFSRLDSEERDKTMRELREGFVGAGETPAEKRAPEALEKFQEQEAVAALDAFLKSRNLRGASRTEAEIRFAMPSPVLFAEGRAAVNSRAREDLAALAAILRQIPKARVVVERVLEEAGFPPGRLSVAGYGEFRPAASNDTPEGRAANRRIEIRVRRRASPGRARPMEAVP